MTEISNAKMTYIDKCNWRCTSFEYYNGKELIRAYFSKETLLAIKIYRNDTITFIPKIDPDELIKGMYIHIERALGISVKSYTELWNEYQLKMEKQK